MSLIILPYSPASKSAKRLAEELQCRRIAVRRSTYRHPRGRKVINWGSQRQYPGIPDSDYLNKPSSVRKASNKLTSLQVLHRDDVPTLGYTTDFREAQRALDAGETNAIYVRNLLSANSGRGIQVCKRGDEVPSGAPLYTFSLGEWTEWRIHLGLVDSEGHVIRIQQKIRRDMSRRNPGTDDIRNHGADYLFRVQDLTIPEEDDLIQVSEDALRAMDLHFGALDMAHTSEGWKVIEINTAAGLDGEGSASSYRRYFERYI